MGQLQFLLDENLDPIIQTALQKRHPKMLVLKIVDPDVPPKGTSDPDILRWCEAHNFCLVTNNRASMPRHLAEHLAVQRHVPAIFVLRPKLTLADLLTELALIWQLAEPEDFADRLSYLPL
jgi:hypothetical protein